ncbi:hypothetical protein FOC88_08205 [Bacillus thuringiensis]|uniref:hypothetical protein n=1 Tax=Bacillus cereus group TaxID=86661 RepID=UPI0005A3295F|nr:hypothetical protein [Bacillus thuringiensis]AJH83024.1 hypothetical protein BF36_1378 [Bacillus thuringiensis]QKI17619.1 hypothetical protein FOC88_08205 [Bacillus thuringiensis]
MTAEIAVLNKTGVALAADSAVTIGTTGAQKVYNSANKLFTLSKYQPVGIMIYGGASFMGIPWENLIKMYRKKLGTTIFNELRDYCNDFIDFLENDSLVKQYIGEHSSVQSIFNFFLLELLEEVNEIINTKFQGTGLGDSDVAHIISGILDEKVTNLRGSESIEGFDDNFVEDFKGKHADDIHTVLGHTIYIDMDVELKEKFVTWATYLMCSKYFSDRVSGVVIAGFGDKEVFPSLYEYNVEGIFCDKLKYLLNDSNIIGAERGDGKSTASIVPFAQKEMVYSFLTGINPDLSGVINQCLNNIFNQYDQVLSNRLNVSFTQEQQKIIQETGQMALELFQKELTDAKRKHYIQPILDIVEVLPKEELAAMAEALVNLTSFKRRVTAEAETVGGPIDVAVITKGDGFVWITRKHYFNSDLNYLFFQNYLRRDENDGNNVR